jgi:hypothetical protein
LKTSRSALLASRTRFATAEASMSPENTTDFPLYVIRYATEGQSP